MRRLGFVQMRSTWREVRFAQPPFDSGQLKSAHRNDAAPLAAGAHVPRLLPDLLTGVFAGRVMHTACASFPSYFVRDCVEKTCFYIVEVRQC